MRSTSDTFRFGHECIAQGFQTLFIMREEGVNVIKTSGVRSTFGSYFYQFLGHYHGFQGSRDHLASCNRPIYAIFMQYYAYQNVGIMHGTVHKQG